MAEVEIRTTKRCPDCGVLPSHPHVSACDVARCSYTGQQRLSCEQDHDDCGEDIWTGVSPGYAECEEYGLYARRLPSVVGWQPCQKDDEGAVPDLNTLYASGEFEWSRDKHRWIKKETT